MNKRHYEHTLPNIRGSLSNTYISFMELSNELKVERIRLSLTAKSVAEEMGISRQQLCNIEQSETAPVVVKYIAFLRSKGVDLNALFDRIIVNK